MSIFARMQKLVQARVNDMLEEMENPLQVIDDAIGDLEKSLGACRQQAQDARGACRLIEHRLEEARKDGRKRQKDAELAVATGHDDLARAALRRRLALDELQTLLHGQLEEARMLSEQLQSDLVIYESRLAEARTRRDLLITRSRAAELRRQVAEQTARLDQIPETTMSSESYAEVSRAVVACEENRRRIQVTSEAVQGIVDTAPELVFERLRIDQSIETELGQLKGKEKPASLKPRNRTTSRKKEG